MRTPCFENRESCPYQYSGCFSDTHHQAWPASDYTSPLERTFRELPENKEQVCRDIHDEYHLEEPPEKPSVPEMMGAVASSDVHIGVSKRKALGL